jgi:Enterobacterial TraT complement resistance protein
MRKTAICTITAAVLLLQGCAATQVALGKRDLDVQTKMSATVFLDPVPPEQMTVFVQVRNTSDRQDLDIAEDVKNAVIAKGYRVVRDPKLAKYYLQANILFVGKTSPTAIQQQTGGGFGAAIQGAALGMAVGTVAGGRNGMDSKQAATAALVGGVAEVVSGSLVKDVYFSIVTDVQIKERLANGKQAQVNSKHSMSQGTSGTESVTFSDQVDMKTYQTRVISSANKMNLEFDEAAPVLKNGLTRALSGMF